MNEKELDMNELIISFVECSTDYTKGACTYYANYLDEYQKEKLQLQNNWNELRKYISSEWYCFDNESVEFEVAKNIIDKMQELEQGKDD